MITKPLPQPASAHFRVDLVDADTNQVEWSGTIAEMLAANGGEESVERACDALANGASEQQVGGGAAPLMILRRAPAMYGADRFPSLRETMEAHQHTEALRTRGSRR